MKLVAIWLLLMVSGADLQAQGVPPYANVTSVDFRGSGCDAESARVSITPDLQYVSILYDRFSAEVGTGSANINAKMNNKNCIVVVKFDLPAGWSLQFDAIEYHGFVSLPNDKTIAQQMVSVDTPMSGKSKDFQQNVLRGPMTDNFSAVFKSPIENLIIPQQSVVNSAVSANLFGQGVNLRGLMLGRGNGPGGNGDGHGDDHGNDQRGGNQGPPRGGPGQGPGGPGAGLPPGLGNKMRHIRKGDMFDCSDRQQNATLRIRSRIAVTNAGDPANSHATIVVDSTDASFTQKLKINWNKCIQDQ